MYLGSRRQKAKILNSKILRSNQHWGIPVSWPLENGWTQHLKNKEEFIIFRLLISKSAFHNLPSPHSLLFNLYSKSLFSRGSISVRFPASPSISSVHFFKVAEGALAACCDFPIVEMRFSDRLENISPSKNHTSLGGIQRLTRRKRSFCLVREFCRLTALSIRCPPMTRCFPPNYLSVKHPH